MEAAPPVEVGKARGGRALFGVLAAAACLFGCRSLDRFDTPGAAAYCGSIVGAPLFHEGFIPTGVPPSLGLRLKLTTSSLSTRPGTLTSNDTQNGFCSADGRALFQDASLRAIPEMFHDTLSQLEFGEGHEQDFFAWVDSNCQGTILAVVSLLTNGAVEVRLMKPAADPPPNAGPEAKPGFALFYMERSENGCGF
ncbi:MAG TPA: hypothetical protein VGK73_28525 [Polyangiaceae bacterium]